MGRACPVVDNGCEGDGDGEGESEGEGADEMDDGEGDVGGIGVDGIAAGEGNVGCSDETGSALVMVPSALCKASATLSSRLLKRPELSVTHISANNASRIETPYIQPAGAVFRSYSYRGGDP